MIKTLIVLQVSLLIAGFIWMTTSINSEACSAISVLITFYLLLRIEACAVREVATIV